MPRSSPRSAAARLRPRRRTACLTPRDFLVVLVALAGEQDHVARPRRRRSRGDRVARGPRSRRPRRGRSRPARIWRDDDAGVSRRGLSLVTTTWSASRLGERAHQRPLGRVAVAAAAEHAPQLAAARAARAAAAPAAPCRARRACAHSRRRPAAALPVADALHAARAPASAPRRPRAASASATPQRAQRADHAEQVGDVVLADQPRSATCDALARLRATSNARPPSS